MPSVSVGVHGGPPSTAAAAGAPLADTLHARLRTAELRNAVSDGVIATLREELRHAETVIAATARACAASPALTPPREDKHGCLTPGPAMGVVQFHDAKPNPRTPDTTRSEEVDSLRAEVAALSCQPRESQLVKKHSDLGWEGAIQQNGHLQMTLSRVNDQLQLAKSALEGSNQDLEQSKAETNRLRTELDSITAKKQLLESKLSFLDRDVRQLQASNAEFRAELRDKQDAVTTQKRYFESRIDTLHRHINQLQLSNAELEAKVKSLESAKSRLKEPASSDVPSGVVVSDTEGSETIGSPKDAASPWLISIDRIREFSSRLEDHRGAFRRNNKWYYADTEKCNITHPRVTILCEDLYWYINFMDELEEELSPLADSDLYYPLCSSPLERLRKHAQIVSRTLRDFLKLWVAVLVAPSHEMVAPTTAKIQLMTKQRVDKLLELVESCVLSPSETPAKPSDTM